MATLENGDHANFVFAFFRPHIAGMSVRNTHSQPQTASPRIITTNQMALNVVTQFSFRRVLSAPQVLDSLPLSA
jgi:hypothetical protein